MSRIHIQTTTTKHYPLHSTPYNPDKYYPEYPWGEKDLAMEPNHVYDMLRESFKALEYDIEKFGTPYWNPLGEIIRAGQTVLIKPNWVAHENKEIDSDPNLTCLVTNPSIVRAIVDYVVIALNGRGRIILGDAPMQGTDLEKLFEKAGYNSLFDFFVEKNINIEIADFRKYRTVVNNGILGEQISIDNPFGSSIIDLKENSEHFENDNKHLSYKVSDYTMAQTTDYHSNGHHIYNINNACLLADVIINIPKPKTHRLGGITGAMKNFIGITYEKASLPHRAQGDKKSGKGDSYLEKNFFKNIMDKFDDMQVKSSNTGHYLQARICNFIKKACYVFGSALSTDKYRIGSWYGNDTIWRTIIDINKIVEYADINGNLCSTCQRKILNIGDMIVCGQKEGPVGPTPKPLGIIMISDDSRLFDYVLCKIMGFNENKIPSVHKSLQASNALIGSILSSNDQLLNKKQPHKILFPKEWFFEPHSCWKENIY